MTEIYICSSNLDRDHVLPAVAALEAAGFFCCVPGKDFGFDGNWEQSVTDAINQSTIILYFTIPWHRADKIRTKPLLDVGSKHGKAQGESSFL